MNVWYSIQMRRIHQDILHGEPQAVSARLLGITQAMIKRINSASRSNSILTPGKKRKTFCRVQSQIDDFDKDWLRRKISSFYKQGQIPLLENVYQSFMTYKTDGQDLSPEVSRVCLPFPVLGNRSTISGGYATNHTLQPGTFLRSNSTTPSTSGSSPTRQVASTSTTTDPPPVFHMSRKTFRKFLKTEMNFKYGKVETRAVICQRDDILKMRGKFLRDVRANEASPVPKKLSYIDETWIGNTFLFK